MTMYLFHNTNIKSLKLILNDGYLKSSKLTNNTKEGEGSGIYDINSFVYFSTTNKIFDSRVYSDITLYFKSDFLYNVKFYVSTMHSSRPNEVGVWKDFNGKLQYKRKYEKHYEDYNKILYNLYKKSTYVLPKGKGFYVFQQVAISNKVNLKNLIGIQFNKTKPTTRLINLINKHYPNVIVEIKC